MATIQAKYSGVTIMQSLSDQQIANIIFNETRSLSGPQISDARTNIAHAIINAASSPHKFPQMAPMTATPGPGEAAIFASCVAAVSTARNDIKSGKDPTQGGTHFNFRSNNFAGAFQGHKLTITSGPFINTYPTKELPASGIYANTYE